MDWLKKYYEKVALAATLVILFGSSAYLYWRVGARNDADRPGPVDWITSSAGNGDRTYRWVYTGIRSFTPADMPPPPP